jgi:hypothetical protein
MAMHGGCQVNVSPPTRAITPGNQAACGKDSANSGTEGTVDEDVLKIVIRH